MYSYEVVFTRLGQKERVYVAANNGSDAVERAEGDLPEAWQADMDNVQLDTVNVTGRRDMED